MITLILEGEPVSMKNSRRIVTVGRGKFARSRLIKSEKALACMRSYEAQAIQQMPARGWNLLEGDLTIHGVLYYASRRPDLDGELICDVLQGIVYSNDRQVKQKIWRWGLDKERPRAVITVSHLPEGFM